ncbi:two-component response regulator ORR26 [Medicago truncatula]|uniref:two-component response regulator ORR26 n=1 Tax=Medicago truncatula TaxID=3880 RepID=UPI000D2F3BDD|nr:two-component response regulator ORR26 [Medicago truncatula]
MALFNDMESLPSQFPEDLNVLVVDHDTDVLNAAVEMSIPCNYQVTTCSKASFAFKLLTETKGCVDVVLIEAQMPDMDSYDFVRHVTQQINISVIMMCDDGSTNAVMKAVTNGACEFWIKPFIENQIKNMWQCVARKVWNENKHDLGILKVKSQSKRGSDYNADFQPLTKKSYIMNLALIRQSQKQFMKR